MTAVNGAAAPALQALSEYQTLEQIAALCTALRPLEPKLGEVAARAEDAQLDRLAFLDTLGLDPTITADEVTVEIEGHVHQLPNVVDDVVRLLTAATPSVAPAEETRMENTSTQTVTHRDQLNGPTALPEPGFFDRYVRPVVSSLRLPTLNEAAIAIAVVALCGAVYEAITSIESDATPVA